MYLNEIKFAESYLRLFLDITISMTTVIFQNGWLNMEDTPANCQAAL